MRLWRMGGGRFCRRRKPAIMYQINFGVYYIGGNWAQNIMILINYILYLY